MNRNNDFNKTKIVSVSNGKAVVDVYADSFGIEKVKIVVSEYEGNKSSVDSYIEFSDFLRMAEQVKTKDIFKRIQASGGKGVDLYRGGTPASRSKREDGKAVSKILSMNMSSSSGTIFLNASKGPGKESGKGAIIPDGAPDAKVSVSLSYDDCLAMFMYTEMAVKAYLPTIFKGVFEAVRSAASANQQG